jgi:WD40 repeat protein
MVGLPAIASVAAGLALAGGGAPPAPVIEPEGAVVFASDRDGDWEIYAVNADGTGLRRLTDNEVDDKSPVPSPDGSRIAVARGNETDEQTVVIRSTDGAEVVLHDFRSYSLDYAWSPDGALLAVAGGGDIAVFDDRGVRTATVTCALGCDRVSWSPDGRVVLGEFDPLDDTWRISLHSLDDGARRALPGWPDTWSPDGRQFVVVRWTDDLSAVELVVVDVVTLGEQSLVSMEADLYTHDFLQFEVTPAWSPKGDLIAFAAAQQEAVSEIFTVDVKTKTVRQLTRSVAGESAVRAVWSPDGAEILFLRGRFRFVEPQVNDQWDVATMGVDGSRQNRLTGPFPDGGTNKAASWARVSLGPLAGSVLPPDDFAELAPAAILISRGIDHLSADGGLAVGEMASPGTPCGPVRAWAPELERSLQLSPTKSGGYYFCLTNREVHGVGLAGQRAVWAYSWVYPTGRDDSRCLLARRIDPELAGSQPIGRNDAYQCGRALATPPASYFDGVHGDEDLLVHTSWRCDGDLVFFPCGKPHSPRLWRVSGGRSIALGSGSVGDVDAGRIAALGRAGTVRILDRTGKDLHSFGFSGATSAQLSGNDLVVVLDDTLEVWDVETGQRRAAYPLERGFGPVPVVEDAEQGIATVVIGVAIHLIRLSDGKDLVLDIENQAGPSHAELEPTGLFYSWNEPYTRKPGRLTFLPWEDVVAAFG